MAATTRRIQQWTCLRCGYQWWPRSPGKPMACAKCKSFYWNRPRRVSSKVGGEEVAKGEE